MQPLEFKFTDQQNVALSVRATEIVNILRSAPPKNVPERFGLSALACTTVLYDVLGPAHSLFRKPLPDAIRMENCPTHTPMEKDHFGPSWFMNNAMSGVLQKTISTVGQAKYTPSWHQDTHGTSKDAFVALYCTQAGSVRIPTAYLSVDDLKTNKDLRNLGLSFVADRKGKSLLYLPDSYWQTDVYHSVSQALSEIKPTNIFYDKNTMFVFRDKCALHRTGTKKEASLTGRALDICEFLDDTNINYRVNPKAALMKLREASRSNATSL